jgi:hypothetical protein
MIPLTRISSLTAACALVVLAATVPASAGEFAQKQAAIGTQTPQVTQCGTLKRAIARRACVARLEQDTPVQTAQNKR